MALRIYTRIHTQGPIFDARAERIFADFSEDLEEEGAEWALADIRRTFHTRFKQPTGYYESHVHISNTALGTAVEDGGANGPVYGPWLEGVGSRNAPVTRFRGYHAFRSAANRLQQRIENMGERLMNRNHIHRF
jgi:hypothetical protein